MSAFPAEARAEIASSGSCVNGPNHGLNPRGVWAHACWKIDGKLYCDDCARKLP